MEPRPPLVSVIVATYRAGDYLRQALASVCAQTCGDFEVRVADDGRDAATREIVEAFGDPRLRYESNPVTLGPAGNHWAAMRRARGQYLAILNHDDLWRPDFLRRTLAGFDADPRVVVAFCDHDVIDPAGKLMETDTAELSRRTGRAALAPGVHCPFPALAVTCAIPTAQAAVFKRAALDLEALPEEAGPAYDLWLNYLLARTGGGAYYVPARLASWRSHPGGISVAPTRSDWTAGGAACWTRMSEEALFAPYRPALRRNAADFSAAAALADLRGGRPIPARRHAARAAALRWTHRRAWAAYLLTWLPGALRRRCLPGGSGPAPAP